MNGFIYWDSESRQPSPRDLRRLAPSDAGTRSEHQSFANGDSLLTWGYPDGDVRVCVQENQSLLILSGYISEISQAPELRSQDRVAEWLLQEIERDRSTAAISKLLAGLHGSFGIVHRNFQTGAVLCLTDRAASRPLWKYHDTAGWIVSSHPNVIAAAAPAVDVDPGGLGAWLLYAGPVDPRKSVYAGVEAVAPGTILRLSENGSAQASTWYRFRHEADRSLSFSDWIDLAAESLLRSASRIARNCPRPVVFFSGGVDSRLAAAALQVAGANPLLVTLGDARNVEVRVAQQAAKALGLEQIVMLRDPHWYLRALPRAAFESGGGFLWVHGHFAEAIRKIREQRGATSFILGDLCEAFSKLLCASDIAEHKLWSPQEFVRDFDNVRMPEYRPRNRERTLSVLRPEIRREAEAALSRDILHRYESMAGSTSDPRILVDQFSRWESVATISTFFMFLDVRGAGAERNLMLDPDMHRLLERLPSDFREGRNLGAQLVRRLNPRAGRVMNSSSLLPICWPPAAHRFSKKCKPMMGKLRRLIQGRSHRTAGAWPEKAVLYATDPRWRGYFESVLSDEASFDSELFDRDRINASWKAFLNGDASVAQDLEKLVQYGILNSRRNPELEPVDVPLGCA